MDKRCTDRIPIPHDQKRRNRYAVDVTSARDDQGRPFLLIQDSAAIPADVTINPSESGETSLMFLAPASVRKPYLTGDYAVMPWVAVYFGSDMSSIPPPHALAVVN
jgi:hypothetical protein